jgi:5-methylcytosine-specific restriction endonuclease McrA
MTTIVYHYGARPPTTNAHLVERALRDAAEYRNVLVDLNTACRDAVREFDRTHGAEDLAAAQTGADAAEQIKLTAHQAVKRHKARTKSNQVPDDLAAALDAARAAHRHALDALRQAKHTARDKLTPEARAERAAIYAHETALAKEFYNATPVYWGTRGLVIRSHEQAKEMKPALTDGTETVNLARKYYRGEGRIGVQVQGGSPVNAMMGDNSAHTLVRITRSHGRADGVTTKPARMIKNGPRKGQWLPERTVRTSEAHDRDYRLLHIRVDSDESRKPVFATIPFTYDRQIPSDAVIKAVAVKVERVGAHRVWTINFTCELPRSHVHVRRDEEKRGMPDVCGNGVVAIDVGWRQVPQGIRVAIAWGSDGHSHELVLPMEWVAKMRFVESIRSIKDGILLRALAAVSALRHDDLIAKPEWFLTMTATISHWRGAGRLVRLVRHWGENRFGGDADVFDGLVWWGEQTPDAHWRQGLVGWLHQDKHLWDYASGRATRQINARDNLYRMWALYLARTYDTVVFEDFDLRDVLRAADQTNETAARNRTLASVSDLRTIISQAFVRLGGCGHETVDAAQSTHECAECHHVDTFDSAAMIHHACSSCGVVWDQDENAAKILLARYCDQFGDDQTPPPARAGAICEECHGKKESHFAKAKRMKREKEAMQATARNTVGNAAE